MKCHYEEPSDHSDRDGCSYKHCLVALCVGDMAEQVGAERVTLDQLLDKVEAWVRDHVGEERAE